VNIDPRRTRSALVLRKLDSPVRAAIIAALALVVGFAVPAAAAPVLRPIDPGVDAPPHRASMDPALEHDARWTAPGAVLPVIVELPGPTALDLYLEAGLVVGSKDPMAVAVRRAIYDGVHAKLAPVATAIAASGATVGNRMDTTMLGFMAYGTRTEIERLALARGVSSIWLAPYHERMLDNGVPQIGADRVQSALGYTGKGVHIAIIDTGIDYFHKSLGGRGVANDFRNNNRSSIEPGSFPTTKVIGGFDFVGAGYTGGNMPAPDNDPVDDQSHGSHVAGIAAGLPGNPNIPAGVAPDAKLIALKVFGARGGTNVVVPAIDWCARANMGERVEGHGARCDIINMSLGSSWAFGVQPYVNVIRRVTQAGVTVLSSAGNSGDVAFITGSPGAAPHTLSVASTVAGGSRVDKIRAFHGGSSEDIDAMEADPQFAVPMGTIGTLRAPLKWLGRACTGDASEMDVTGAIALIQAGGCSQGEVVERALAEGAVGAVLYNTVDQLLPVGTGGDSFQDPIQIPVFGIALSGGVWLRDLVDGGTDVEVQFDAQFKNSVQKDGVGDTISGFSSRGPSRIGIIKRDQGGELKPEIAAPGSSILAPLFGTGDRGARFSGTSMASPMAAGAAALLFEKLRSQEIIDPELPLTAASNPQQLDALDVAAMLVNYTATVWRVQNSEPVALALGGSGRIDVLQAARGTTIVRAGEIASIHYGRRPFSVSEELEGISFTIKNTGDVDKRYQISGEMLFRNDENRGMAFLFTSGELDAQDRITIPAGSRKVVTVRPLITPERLKPFGAYGGANVMSRGMTDAEYDAHVVVQEVDDAGEPVAEGDRARVPMYLVPRGTSLVHAANDTVTVDRSSLVGAATFRNASRVDGRAELFALIGEDHGDNVAPQMDIERVGARVVEVDGRRYIEVALQTLRPRQIPLESSFRLFLDTDRDGSMDYMVFNDDLAWFLGSIGIRQRGLAVQGTQRMLVVEVAGQDPFGFRFPVAQFGGDYAHAEYAEVTLDTRLMILRAPVTALGYAADAPVAFDAIVWHHANFEEIRGSSRYDPYESVPDGGFVMNSGGGRVTSAGVTYNDARLTDKRLQFDERRLGFELDQWTVPVDGEGEAFATVTKRDLAGPDVPDKIWAVYTFNTPDEFFEDRIGDNQVLSIETGSIAPPPTRVPSATPTPAEATPDPGTDPTAIATRPALPEGAIFMPLAARDSDIRDR
jgi:minor extracellular serine protease Vpr